MIRRLLVSLLLAIAVVAPIAPTRAAPATQTRKVGVTITRHPGAVPAGGTASVAAKTAPQAACTINVSYKTGRSKAKGLGPQTASGAGMVSWSWNVGTNTTAGKWPVVITCKNQGSAQTWLTVTR